jgi:mRNA interferase MazF
MEMSKKSPNRGDIWWAALDPTVGAEIKKTRPCLVLSMDVINEHRRTVIAVPLSTSAEENPPITVKLTCQGKLGIAIVDQMRAISKKRLRNFIEKADSDEVNSVTRALMRVVEAG